MIYLQILPTNDNADICHQSSLDWPESQPIRESGGGTTTHELPHMPSLPGITICQSVSQTSLFPYRLSQPTVLYTLGSLCPHLPCPCLIKSFLPSPINLLSLIPPSLFSTQLSFNLLPFHSLTHSRLSWKCTAVTKTLSRVASQARETASTHQIRHHSRPHTDVALSRLQATLAVTTSTPPQETLSTQHRWAPPRIPQPFTSITKSRTKDTFVLDG